MTDRNDIIIQGGISKMSTPPASQPLPPTPPDQQCYIITGHATFEATPPEAPYDWVEDAALDASEQTSGVFFLPTEPQYAPMRDVHALLAWANDAMDELHDIRGQWGDDYLWKKHNEKPYQELWERLAVLRNPTESG